MKVIAYLSMLILAVMGFDECPEVKVICDHEMSEVALKFKGECCGNKWVFMIFLAELQPQFNELMNTDIMSVGMSMMSHGLSKDVEADNEKLKKMDEMVRCLEKQFKDNEVYNSADCKCTKISEESKDDEGRAKKSKLGCLGKYFFESCPEVMAMFTGDYDKLAEVDNVAYPSQ